jgi:hypothetical protein
MVVMVRIMAMVNGGDVDDHGGVDDDYKDDNDECDSDDDDAKDTEGGDGVLKQGNTYDGPVSAHNSREGGEGEEEQKAEHD